MQMIVQKLSARMVIVLNNVLKYINGMSAPSCSFRFQCVFGIFNSVSVIRS